MTLSSRRRSRLLTTCSLTPAVLAACVAGAAVAQTEDASEVEAIVVTGSRIDRAGFEAPTPTVKITAEQLTVGARSNVAAALNDMPQFRATTSPQTTGTNTGAGNAPLDLRGLGISRTLILLDGRRFSSENDLNAIPNVLIKGVDVVTGGASAAWGSGAVAGVANITINRTLEGGKFGAQYGISSYDDAEEFRFEGAYGAAFADGRGHFVIGGEYLHNDGVTPKVSRPNVGRWAQVSAGPDTDAFINVGDVGFSNAAYGGLILSGIYKGKVFNPDGSLRNFQYGRVDKTLMVGGEGPSNDDLSPLVTPQQRYNLLASVTYDLTDNVKLTADVRHARMWNDYIWFGDHNRGNLTIKSDNAFLPQAMKDALASAGETSFTMGRFNSDLSYSRIDFERVTTQLTFALDGTIGDGWRWSGYVSHGEYENNIDTPGFLLTKEYAQAVDSVLRPGTNTPICRVALTDPSTNCVPINLFGLGAPSKEAIAYVTGTPQQRARTTLDVGGISLRGEPFSLPAGDVSIAVGAEARREKVVQHAGALDRAKAFQTFSFSDMSGEFTVKEAFAEVLVPLVADVPVFNRLELNAAARISDYDTSGSIWSWKVGATNEFFPGFRGRITQSRDIRSANLTELFTTTTIGYNWINDPRTPTRPAETVYVKNIGGGNPNLKPETADTLTLGVTYAPPAIAGLNMSLDYFHIKIDDVITTIAPQDVVTRCSLGNLDLCSRITRDNAGSLLETRSTYVNLSKYETDGFDAEVSYTTSLDSFFEGAPGRVNLRLVGTWVNSLTTDDGVKEIEYVRSQGYSFGLGVPKLRLNGTLGWKGDDASAYIRARYISEGAYNSTVKLVNNHIEAFTYVDIGGTVNLPDFQGNKVELYGNITNLFDKDPPPGSLYSPYYDVIGRYFTVGARLSF
ncbi:TonB-dependent receptor domain-containing protein [Caulobacter mirabilis]|uniref:Outer membrane receptor protein n=1 Tax=Caulobacter mirabilis TaxID=69666 RepID=A0A2D2AZ79_9CAUL|nr:TonB-dependent receptor [Caulobacter mirabilis]ATQ43320.1 outer membrane receptor protein [Caulobacter mirabilis]